MPSDVTAIVSYTNLIKPFGGSQDKLLAKTQEVAAKKIGDPAKVAARMADLKTALDDWQEAEIHPRILHTPRNAVASRLQSHIVKHASLEKKIESFLMTIAGRVLEGLEVRFSSQDLLGWMASFFDWSPDIAVQPPPGPGATAIGNHFAIGVLGDFGTGLYGAPFCKESIEDKIRQGERYDLMLHLGDVYYSATPDEVQARFFDFWPAGAAMDRTMNGNHEMYNGGHSFFETMLPQFSQTASYFALQNDYWAIAVLDTAYYEGFGGKEGVFDDEQMKWLRGIITAAEERKVVLFSHHQPFSRVENNNGGNLIAQMEKHQIADKIFAWYWGHEHRCLMYDQHRLGFFGRCAGHAAFPESRPNLDGAPESQEFGSQWRQLDAKGASPGAWIYDTNNLYVPEEFVTDFAPNGYLRLEFRDDELHEHVRTPDSSDVWSKQLVKP